MPAAASQRGVMNSAVNLLLAWAKASLGSGPTHAKAGSSARDLYP